LWDDPGLGIRWPDLGARPTLSAKDQAGSSLEKAQFFD
jgi:dTDP-4-dehydrorhamnose 3,5-epimerase